MRDIRELLSGPLHIKRMVFSCGINHVQHDPEYREETRIHFYMGALSTDRFLLIEIPSPEAANGPVDLLALDHPAVVARTSDTDFYYNGPLFTPQPRLGAESNLERAFRIRLGPLRQCLQLGLNTAKPESFRWEGDRFSADYTEQMKIQGQVTVSFPEGTLESMKEKFLADLQNPPAERSCAVHSVTRRFARTVTRHGRVVRASDVQLEPPGMPEPAPGSVEARIMAYYEAKHEASIAKGIKGELLRDEHGNVSEIRLDEGPYRIELEYSPSEDLPLPWPHRITRIFTARTIPSVNPQQITIYSARISEQPLDDAHFLPWGYLKEGTYVRGKALPNGRFTVADPKDQLLWHELRQLHAARRANSAQQKAKD
jgi:hypothetical protein